MHKQLDDYLETLGSELRVLPPQELETEIEEMRQHLDALIATYRARGYDEDDAVRCATEQFGKAGAVGRELRQSWKRKQGWPLGLALFWSCFAMAIGIGGAAQLMIMLGDLYLRSPLYDVALDGAATGNPWVLINRFSTVNAVFTCWMLIAVPFIAGYIPGRYARSRAVPGVAGLFGVLIILACVTSSQPSTSLLPQLCPELLSYMLVGCVAAWLGERWKQGLGPRLLFKQAS